MERYVVLKREKDAAKGARWTRCLHFSSHKPAVTYKELEEIEHPDYDFKIKYRGR